MSRQARLPEIIAHRGESYDAPENTLAAFELAWQRGADAVELDVHLTRDGHLVCIHDADTKRTTGMARVVGEATLADLQACDAGAWKGAQYAGQTLPTLEQVLGTIPPGRRLLIELKAGVSSADALADLLQRSRTPPEQTAVISFSLDACRQVKRRRPELQVYLLASFRQNEVTKRWSPGVEQLIADATEAVLDGLDLSWRGPIDRAFVQQVRGAGLRLYVWTINDPQTARRFVDLGVDGITTDRPAWLREQLLHENAK